jgi:hypothetical protein
LRYKITNGVVAQNVTLASAAGDRPNLAGSGHSDLMTHAATGLVSANYLGAEEFPNAGSHKSATTKQSHNLKCTQLALNVFWF